MSEEEKVEEEEKEEDKEEEEAESDTEKRLNDVVDKKVDKIVKAIQEKAEVNKLDRNDSTPTKSVMEVDPFRRKNHPFVKLSDEMTKFLSITKLLVNRREVTGSLSKALQESDDTAGGFLVPEEFRNEVIRFATEVAIVRSGARVFPMRSNVLTLPQLDQSNYKFSGVDIHWEGDEGDLKEESQPKFGRITLNLNKMIGLVPVSDDLLSDSPVNVANYLVSLFGEAIAYEEDRQFLIGNGMNKPMGIVNCGTSRARTGAGCIVYEDLKHMVEDLPVWAEAGARWILTKAALTEVLDIKSGIYTGAAVDQTEGFPLFLPGFSIAAGIPKTILGFPYSLTDKLPAVGNKGDMILGNLSAYFIGDKGGLAVTSSIHDRFRYDETVLRFVKRVDGQCALPKAFVILDDA